MKARMVTLSILALFMAGAVLSQDLVIRGGTILTMTGQTIPGGVLIIRGGKIEAMGRNLTLPPGVPVLDARDTFIMPGIIDSHVHYGLTDDINEATDPVTPQVWMKDVLRPDDDALRLVLAGGVTAVKTMHGSANVIGGVNVTIKLKYGEPPERLIIPDARPQLKMALGENPKGLYGPKNRIPSTRMGEAYVARKAFQEAREYKAKWDRYQAELEAGKTGLTPPARDSGMETLKMVLEKKMSIDCHAYRSDDIYWIINFCRENDLDLLQISHCTDGYKVADLLARHRVSYGGWTDAWGFKEEAYDGCPWGIALMHEAGVNVVINTDSVSAGTSRYLYAEAARVLRYNNLPDEEVLKMITINAAKALEIGHRTGSLAPGKDGDVAIFDRHPLDSMAKCRYTIIEGKIYFDYQKARSGGVQ